MTFKEQVAKVKTLLASVFEDIQPAAGDTTGADTLQSYVTDGGVNVKIDKLEAGGMVFMEDGTTPVTTGFTLADGTIVAVDGNGVITAVTVPVAATVPEVPAVPSVPAIPAAPAYPAGFEERLSAIEKEFEARKGNGDKFHEQILFLQNVRKDEEKRYAEYGKALAAVVELVEKFAAQPSEDPAQPPSGAPSVPSKTERREAFAKSVAERKKQAV